MSGNNQTGSTLRAAPTGNPYAPPATMMRPVQGYQPQNMPQQRPQVDYSYRSQYVAPISRPMPQWAKPERYEMPTLPAYTGPKQITDPNAPGFDSYGHQMALGGQFIGENGQYNAYA